MLSTHPFHWMHPLTYRGNTSASDLSMRPPVTPLKVTNKGRFERSMATVTVSVNLVEDVPPMMIETVFSPLG